jgi:guanyl-specific ribonuclease Sa
MPAPGPVTRGIGREAFVPTTPPVPRGEAVRQLRAPPTPAPVGRQTVVISAAAGRRAAPAAQLRPTVEAPKPVARPAVPIYTQSSSLSAAEAAAAAAAAMSAARVAESAPAPAPAPAPRVPQAPAPAPAVSAPAQPPAAVIQRPARGAARAYAMDGATFYQGGRKIRVQGLDVREPGMTSEHATQRLQRALDGGSLSVEPVETDGSGT